VSKGRDAAAGGIENHLPEKRRILQRRFKRAGDLILSFVLGIVTLPLTAILSLIIKLDSDGPAIFRARRVGLEGREFTLYKFRSMYADAEERLAELAHMNVGGGHLIKIPNDPRVTKVGRFLRKYSLDELPQLWNVLKGDMSLVGPRPQSPSEVALYTEHQRRRLGAVPGITGLWQVSARDDPRFEVWVAKDLEYIDNWSLWLDIRVLFQTIGVVLGGKDASPKTAPRLSEETEGHKGADETG